MKRFKIFHETEFLILLYLENVVWSKKLFAIYKRLVYICLDITRV